MELLSRARAYPGHADWRGLDVETLSGVSAGEGIDFATALLYARLRDSAEQGPAIRALEAASAHPTACEPGVLRGVAVVPGGCHEESPDSRDCLRRIVDQLQRHGLEVRVIPTESFGLLPDNARVIVRAVRQLPGAPWILVSLSKGSAEVKLALRDEPAAFENVQAWVNVSGLLYGSQWVRWLLRRTVSRWGARAWSWYWRYPFAALRQLVRESGSLLDFELAPPPHLRCVHVVGFPLCGDLIHRYAERSFARLAPWGPSDGMGFLLGDLTRVPGTIYPVWRADHFLRPGELRMQDFVVRAFHWLRAAEVRDQTHVRE
ncbi:MAG: hypothetical protein J5I93_06155 [Pirellulaceae bacterium]|nr:hypothetical protein [Pirellulaceae bacterium]